MVLLTIERKVYFNSIGKYSITVEEVNNYELFTSTEKYKILNHG